MATPKRKAEEDAEAAVTKQPRGTATVSQMLETPPELDEAVDGYARKGSITYLNEMLCSEGYLISEREKPTACRKPAKEYPFSLDPFQREAIQCLEAGESVLVRYFYHSGHTGGLAGVLLLKGSKVSSYSSCKYELTFDPFQRLQFLEGFRV